MDAFDYADITPPRPRKDNTPLILNIITILLLLATLFVAIVFFTILTNPNSSFNPFPPPTLTTPMAYPTATETPRYLLPPTWTPVPSATPLPTETPGPTLTPFITETPLGFPTATTTPTPKSAGMSFIVKQGSIRAISNIYDMNVGCNWMGAGGQAVDMSGAPVVGLLVQFGGTLEGKRLEGLYMTGTATQLGKGGFVIPISDHPVVSNGTLWIQLLDQQSLPLSDKVYFDTTDNCEKNLVLIYFNQVR